MGEQRCQTSHSEPATTATATPTADTAVMAVTADMAHTAMGMAIRMAQDHTMAGTRGLPRLRTAMATHTARTMVVMAVIAVMAQHIRGMATATPMAALMAALMLGTEGLGTEDMDMATHMVDMAGATMATTRFSTCLCVCTPSKVCNCGLCSGSSLWPLRLAHATSLGQRVT